MSPRHTSYPTQGLPVLHQIRPPLVDLTLIMSGFVFKRIKFDLDAINPVY